MPKASKSPLRDALLRVISQLPMSSATAGQLRTITGLDKDRISFSLNRWVRDGYLVSVGNYRRRYFRFHSDALTWAANPVDLPVDQALIAQISLWVRAELEATTHNRIQAPNPSLPPRISRPMTAEERQQEAERRAQRRHAQKREQEGDRAKPRINYRHRIVNTAVAQSHTGQAMPAPVTVSAGATNDSTVIVQPTARITRAPTRPGRFEATGPVIGGFATLPLGRYLDEAGFSKYLETNA